MILGGFEGFDWTNPRDQLGGERSHLFWSKHGQGGERFLPHHSTSVTIQLQEQLRKQSAVLEGFCKARAHCSWERSSWKVVDTGSERDLTSEVLVITRVPFCFSDWVVSSTHSLYHLEGWVFSWGGCNVHWGSCVLEGNTFPNSLDLWHRGFLIPYIYFGS